MIEVRDLRKSFGSLQAVNGVSFDIKRGECFGLLGPNGAGKSTTLNIIVGVLAPDSGAVAIHGQSDPSSASTHKDIGVAPQAIALYEEFTGEENLRFFGQLYKLSGSALADRVNWALDFAELKDRRKSRVSTYSGGMKRRLNLAAALIHDPKVILLDEPTVGVDPQSRNHIFDRIEQLKGEGRTVIYTTHYMEEAERLCDRIAIIDQGKLLAIGTLRDLLDRHGGLSSVECELAGKPSGVSYPGEIENGKLRFQAERPIEEITKLASAGVEIANLTLTQPDLEGVFLSLTGRSLRDE